jgi:mono/diheme cytochrome c family protein
MQAKLKVPSLILLCGLVFPSLASSQETDATVGRRIVQSECTRCHAIEPGATGHDPGAPNFTALSRMPSVTDLSLRVFLQSSHRSMPNLVLREDETSSIIAYLRGLAR